jgi:hydrogenase/urease accessory protein HupE
MGRRFVRILSLLVLACLFLPRLASAHAIGVSNGDYTADADGLDAKIVFARGDAKDLSLADAIVVTRGGAKCEGALGDATPTEADGLSVHGRFSCPKGDAPIAVEARFLSELSFGHRHIAHAQSGDDVLFRNHPAFSIAPAAKASTTTTTPEKKDASRSALGFFRMGLEHILTGYDHLVFLFGLVLVRGRVRSMLAIVTAFTAAHSITLAIATLGWYTPSPRIVEPAIALSIAYVGIENFLVKSAKGRWRITFPFGLIHGFGFASALRELDLPKSELPMALATFNLGVESGQLLCMALLLPAVWLLRDRMTASADSARSGKVLKVLSAAVAAMGGVWFALRVMSS